MSVSSLSIQNPPVAATNVTYSVGQAIPIGKWITIAFLVRLALMLVVHFSGAETSMRLTKDAFLYDEVGVAIAEYYSTGGSTAWPDRVTRFIDFGWEHFIGVVYYLVGHEPLAIKLVCVLAGALVPLVHCRTALIVTDDTKVAWLVLLVSVFFPTQVYYSALMVRDSVSALGVSLLFLGLAQFIRQTTYWWWLTLLAGFLILISLRSYLVSMLSIVLPLSFLATAIFAKSGRSRAFAGVVTIGAVVAGTMFLLPALVGDLDTQFTDIDYVNKIRNKMNRGSGAMFSDGSVTEVGSSLIDTVTSFLVGTYFFFFSINPTQLTSPRQMMALPEVVLVGVGVWFGIRGSIVLWQERRDIFLPLALPTLAMTLGYSAATTNGGPLMRWRMQLLCVYLIIAATGIVAVARRNQAVQRQYQQQGKQIG